MEKSKEPRITRERGGLIFKRPAEKEQKKTPRGEERKWYWRSTRRGKRGGV